MVTQLLVSNKSTSATGNVSVVSNRYESPYAAAGPGFSPEAEPFFARPAVGDDLHLRADVLSKAYSNAGRVEDPIGANGTQ